MSLVHVCCQSGYTINNQALTLLDNIKSTNILYMDIYFIEGLECGEKLVSYISEICINAVINVSMIEVYWLQTNLPRTMVRGIIHKWKLFLL